MKFTEESPLLLKHLPYFEQLVVEHNGQRARVHVLLEVVDGKVRAKIGSRDQSVLSADCPAVEVPWEKIECEPLSALD